MRPINFHANYMILELTNKCNSNCIHCIREVGSPHLMEQGFIKKEAVKKLMDNLYENNIKFYDLNLFWLGDPLMHPDFAEIYRYILKKSQEKKMFSTINIHTNAFYLSREIIDILKKYPDIPQTWHLTLDANTKETYLKIKQFDGFDTAKNNAIKLIKEKSGKFPRIVMQFIVEEENCHEAKPFIEFWENQFKSNKRSASKAAYYVPGYVDNFIFLRQFDCITGGEGRQKTANEIYRKAIAENNIPKHDYKGKESLFDMDGFIGTPIVRKNEIDDDFSKAEICSGFWKTPTISWNGDVTVCARDTEMKLKVGNINEHKFSDIWWENADMKSKRNAMINQDFKEIGCCKDCMIPKSSNYSAITKEQLELYKKHQNEK